MVFREWWVKKSIIKKSMWIAIISSFFLSTIHLLIFTIIPSVTEGKLICGAFTHGGGCGNFLGFLLFFVLILILGFTYSFIPIFMVSIIVGGFIKLIKRKK